MTRLCWPWPRGGPRDGAEMVHVCMASPGLTSCAAAACTLHSSRAMVWCPSDVQPWRPLSASRPSRPDHLLSPNGAASQNRGCVGALVAAACVGGGGPLTDDCKAPWHRPWRPALGLQGHPTLLSAGPLLSGALPVVRQENNRACTPSTQPLERHSTCHSTCPWLTRLLACPHPASSATAARRATAMTCTAEGAARTGQPRAGAAAATRRLPQRR